MSRRLLLAVAIVTAASLAFVVAEVMGKSVAVLIPNMIRLDGLSKAASSGGISSRYVITNLGTGTATTLHEFYDELDQYIGSPIDGEQLGAGQAKQYDLANITLPSGYTGYVVVASDQPITGTVLPALPADTGGTVFLPLVIKSPPPPPPEPLVRGEIVRFLGVWEDVPLVGKVVSSEYRTVLVGDYSGPVYPYGIFVVAVMDVTNIGLVSDEVGLYRSFRLRDSVGRQFDLADVLVQLAAEDEYGYDSVYEPIQPGYTRRLVFVFDVLPASEGLHLISLSPW